MMTLSGLLIVAIVLLSLAAELTGTSWPGVVAGLVLIVYVALSFSAGRQAERVFILLGAIFLAATVVLRPDWRAALSGPLTTTAFIAAFLAALTTLRSAAATSPIIKLCGQFFADQPPSRRYAALTAGGHLFSLVLSYGSLSLLGAMVKSMTFCEPDHEIRSIGLQRMLLAIQRGMIAILCWSPIAFPMAITTTAIEGAVWQDVGLLGFIGAVMLMGTGWLLDTLLKARRTGTARPFAAPASSHSWRVTLPLLFLLFIVLVLILVTNVLLGLRAAAAVILVIPTLSGVWIAMQSGQGQRLGALSVRTRRFVCQELPSYRPEIVILTMAGAIGSLLALLLEPALKNWAGVALYVPPLALLIVLMWVAPLLGQFGMNPIMSVTLIAMILPPAHALGLTPGLLVLALTFGWALCGASSPFSATTLLLSRLSNIGVWRVGLGWNGPFTALGGIALSLWLTAIYLCGLV